MSFAAREGSRLNGRPFHLYEFKLGDVVIERYTNLAAPITYRPPGDTVDRVYEPLAISHGEITAAGNLDRSALEVRLPESGAVPDIYRDDTPSAILALFIRQGHVGDTDFKVCWVGRVKGVSFEGAEMVLECEPITSSLRRPGLTRDYQYACPLVLYGEQCRASRAAATFTAIPSTINGPLITLPSSWAPEGRKPSFVGGIAEWTNAAGRTVRRAIIERNGDVLTLASAAHDLADGQSINLVLGCRHTQDDCRLVHNNILNFGGQPAIPLVNPIGITNNYY